MLHFTCEVAGNKGEAFVGLMGRSISGEGELKAFKKKKKQFLKYQVSFIDIRNINLLLNVQQSGFFKRIQRQLREAID